MKKFLFFLVILLLTRNVHAFTLEHEFDVFIGKFNASRTNFTYTLSDKFYELKSDVKTYGTFDTLYPFQAIYSTSGTIDGDVLTTRYYRYTAKSRFNTRAKELVYDENGVPLYNISSKNKKERKREIDKSIDIEGTTDLQTVFAEMVKQFNKTKTCDSRMEVFDGKRRFDVIFKTEGVEEIKADKYMKFSGEATKCIMYIDGLGNKGADLLMELSLDRPVYFWVMEYGEKKRPFIARAEIEKTGYGRLVVYTRKVTLYE